MIKKITNTDIKRILTGRHIGEIKYVSRLDYPHHRSPCTLFTTGRLHRFHGHKDLQKIYDPSNQMQVSAEFIYTWVFSSYLRLGSPSDITF